MPAIIIVTLLSFFFQGFISTILNYTLTNPTIFSTIYTLLTLIIIRKYFENPTKYYIFVAIFGFLYDLTYTNSVILNTALFLAITFLIDFFKSQLSDTILTANIAGLIAIVIYNILSYLILTIIGYNNYNPKFLLIILTHSILMTVIFTSIMYFLIDYLYTKFDLKPIR